MLNALARNATLIGLPNERVCADDAVSPFSQPGALPLPDQKAWPVALKPTPVQYEGKEFPMLLPMCSGLSTEHKSPSLVFPQSNSDQIHMRATR